MSDNYKIIGPLYDFLSMIFSAGQIDRCKKGMHDYIEPDNKVVFAGVGQGIDAIAAAERGAQVTIVDLSETMLDIFNKRIQGRYFVHPIRQVNENIFNFQEYSEFDMVYANFFLNVFTPEAEARLIEHLVRLVKPKGYVSVGDFCIPDGGPVHRFFQNFYWYIADVIFFVMAKNALHPVYDYQQQLRHLGLSIMDVRYFKFLFDNRYYSILAQKE